VSMHFELAVLNLRMAASRLPGLFISQKAARTYGTRCSFSKAVRLYILSGDAGARHSDSPSPEARVAGVSALQAHTATP
jgi:hypothetical protein